MGLPPRMEALAENANHLREALHKCQCITDDMVSVLATFDYRLSTLQAAMHPTQVRTRAMRTADENIEKTLRSAEAILGQFDLSRQVEEKIRKGPHEDLDGYFEAVDQLRSIECFFSSNNNFKKSDDVINNTNDLLEKAILNLEEEFRGLLSSYSKVVEPQHLFDWLPDSRQASGFSGQKNDDSQSPSATSEHQVKNLRNAVFTLPTLVPPRILPQLHDLAKHLLYSGRQHQCLKAYRDIRSSALEKSLEKLGVEKLSKDDVQKMQWEVLENKIANWIHYMRIAVKLLFAGERKVCDQIFDAYDSVKEQCFAEVISKSVAVLLSFGEAIAKSKRSPEKLFVLLDMYETMCELHSEIGTILKGKACSELRDSAFSLAKLLAQTAWKTFCDFEEAVEKDTTKTTVHDGTIHPLTSYVVNYVKFLFDYKSTLKHLFEESETEVETNSQLAAMTMRIMQALQSNLDIKSKQYKDPALAYLFLMNNIHYVVRSVCRSEAKDLLGDDWVERHRRIVQKNANQYRRVAWAKILESLSAQGISSSGGGGGAVGGDGISLSSVSRATVKERFRTFNLQFEELHQRQSQWTVSDLELRESLQLAVAEILLPAYRYFIKRFGSLVDNGGKNLQKYVKYTPEDLEQMLGQFFEGKSPNEQTHEDACR